MPYYTPSNVPVTQSRGASAPMRSEFSAIAAGFALLPTPTGVAGEGFSSAVKVGTATDPAHAVTLAQLTTFSFSPDMGGNRIINLGAAAASTDACRYDQAQTLANTAETNAKSYALGLAFSTALPSQTGNAGRVPRTDGTTTAWASYWGSTTKLTGAATVSINSAIEIDSTSGSFNLTLPASPSLDDYVMWSNPSGSLGTNPVTLLRNGNLIMGIAEDHALDIAYFAARLVWRGGSIGWGYM